MSKIGEIIVSTVLPMFKSIGVEQLGDLLEKMKEHNTPETYETFIRSEYGNTKLLQALAIKTKTRIDDTIVDVFLVTLETAAAEAGIEL